MTEILKDASGRSAVEIPRQRPASGSLCQWGMALVLLVGSFWISPPAVARQHVVVVLDDSGSMDERMRSARGMKKIEAAKEALLSVLRQLPPESEMGIVLLNGQHHGSSWVVPLGPIDLATARQAIRRVGAEGGTPLGEFLKVGTDALLARRAKNHYGDYRLLVVTDGEATDPDLMESYLPDILSRGITLDVIGVDMPSNHSLATRVNSYRRADDPSSLTRAIREVLAETSTVATDARESDFELLVPLDDDAAVAMLAALAESGNGPIRGWDSGRVDDGGSRDLPGTGTVPRTVRPKVRLSITRVIGALLFCYLLSKILQVRRRRR